MREIEIEIEIEIEREREREREREKMKQKSTTTTNQTNKKQKTKNSKHQKETTNKNKQINQQTNRHKKTPHTVGRSADACECVVDERLKVVQSHPLVALVGRHPANQTRQSHSVLLELQQTGRNSPTEKGKRKSK
jgi:hypothetical protein